MTQKKIFKKNGWNERLIKAYLKVVKAKEICQEVNLSNTTISELKNGRKSLDTLKFRSFEALYIAAKKYFTADNK
ncbi:hypothetical protein OUS11_002600 [Enterococcus hirae]|nr:hypothetical protein [Enterococcus hirae]